MMMYKKGAHDMSYEIVVKKGGRIVRLEDDSEARTNVTFNYSDLLEQAFGDPNGIRILNRRKAENAVRLLKNAINNLSDDNPGADWRPAVKYGVCGGRFPDDPPGKRRSRKCVGKIEQRASVKKQAKKLARDMTSES